MPRKAPELFTGKDLANLQLEKDFQQQVVEYATLNGWRVYSVPDSRRASIAGFPDLTLWKPNKSLIFAELKRMKGRVSPSQTVTLEELNSIPGVCAYLWRPSDWPEIEKALGPPRKK